MTRYRKTQARRRKRPALAYLIKLRRHRYTINVRELDRQLYRLLDKTGGGK